MFRPALDVAFSLTGFVCGGLAMAMTGDRLERRLALGFVATAALLGRGAWRGHGD